MEQGDQGVLVSPDFWRPVQIGNTKLGFAETGIVAGQTRVLVNAGTTVFYLSTYATVSEYLPLLLFLCVIASLTVNS